MPLTESRRERASRPATNGNAARGDVSAAPNQPSGGGCVGPLLASAAVFAVVWWPSRWMLHYDNVASACPASRVSTVVTHIILGGLDWTVTCVNGERVHVSGKGKVRRA